jgi:hypothetical protein
MNATSLAVLIATIIFHSERFALFRPSWFDLPIVIYCVAPFISLQGVGFPIASSAYWSLDQCFEWGLPYFMGRLYIRDLDDVHELVRVLLICGLVYVPFCLFEARMSPQLHRIVYGFMQHSFNQTRRWGGFRPMVFMQHGLMVGTWMTSTAVLAFWAWKRRAMQPIWGMSMGVVAIILLATAILCKSAGATVLMVVSIAVLLATQATGRRWLIAVLIASPAVYTFSRVTGVWDGRWLTAVTSRFSEERSDSIGNRLGSEDNFIRHALKRPLIGWGPGPQAEPPISERVQARATWDALWIINFTKFGALGLVSWLLIGALPGTDIRAWPRDWRWLWCLLRIRLIAFLTR